MKKTGIIIVLLIFKSYLLFSQETVGVLDITPGQDVSEMEVYIVTDFVYDALYRFSDDTYMIISRQKQEALLAEHEFSLSGFCDDTSCALEVGKYLSADYVIIGSFTKFGSRYYLSLQLLDVITNTVSGSFREGADDLDGIASIAVDTCVAGVFGSQRMGSLLVDQQASVVEPDLKIGEPYAGGLVFYLDGKGGGLACSEEDQRTNIEWGGFGNKIGTTSTAVGTGTANTEAIVAKIGEGTYAAKVCYDLELNGYDDWFLPSKDELNMMYENLHKNGLGDFADAVYWSSSEYGSNYSWLQNFRSSTQYGHDKGNFKRIRAVRVFRY